MNKNIYINLLNREMNKIMEIEIIMEKKQLKLMKKNYVWKNMIQNLIQIHYFKKHHKNLIRVQVLKDYF